MPYFRKNTFVPYFRKNTMVMHIESNDNISNEVVEYRRVCNALNPLVRSLYPDVRVYRNIVPMIFGELNHENIIESVNETSGAHADLLARIANAAENCEITFANELDEEFNRDVVDFVSDRFPDIENAAQMIEILSEIHVQGTTVYDIFAKALEGDEDAITWVDTQIEQIM